MIILSRVSLKLAASFTDDKNVTGKEYYYYDRDDKDDDEW